MKGVVWGFSTSKVDGITMVINSNIGDDTPWYIMLITNILAKFITDLVALAVKSSWVDSDRDIFMLIFSDVGLGFAAALLEIEQEL